MSAQTSYALKQSVAYAGMIFALGEKSICSRSVETAAGIGFGVAVSRGTDKERQVVVGGTDFIGITVRDLHKEGSANGAIKWNENETAAVMRSGEIWCVCPTGCNPGDAVNYVNTTGVLDSGAAVAGETQLDGAYWDSTASAGELAVIRIETSATTAGS